MTSLGRVGVVAAAIGVLAGAHVSQAGAQPIEVGQVQIVGEDGDPVSGGGSTTRFTFDLPTGSTCPGDSRNDGYRVNSYMVPEHVDPRDVTYDGLGPTPTGYGANQEFRQPLYDINTSFFVSDFTADNAVPGQPGLILAPPLFDFGVYAPGDIPEGRYHVGVACTLLNGIERVWDTRIDVVEASGDAPAGIRWTVVDVEPTAPGGDANGVVPVVVGLLILSSILTFIVVRRRASAVARRRPA